MTTMFKEDEPVDTDFVGEGDDDHRETRGLIKTAFAVGHVVSDPADSSVDGHLKYVERVVTPANTSGNITLDLSLGTMFVVAATGAITGFTISNCPSAGFGFLLVIKNVSGGELSVTFPSSVSWMFDLEPEMNEDVSGQTWMSFMTIDTAVSWAGTYMGEV